MKKAIGVTVVVMLVTTLSACAPSSAPAPPTTPTPATTQDKKPEDVMPLNIPGFESVNITRRSDLSGELVFYVEYYVESSFKPEANSKFEGKVVFLKVLVYLCKDAEASNELFTIETGNPVAELQVNNTKAIWSYDDPRHTIVEGVSVWAYDVIIKQQYGKLIVTSMARSHQPFDAPVFDEQALKEAAIEALRSLRL